MDFASGRKPRRAHGTVALVLASAASWCVAPHFSGFVGTVGRLPRQLRARVWAAEAVSPVSNVAIQDAKAKLLDLLEDDSLQQEVLRAEGKPIRGRLDEAIVGLERLNSNEEPVYSMELDGTWNVKYSGSYAPGLLSSPTRELALFLYGGGFSLGNALASFAEGFWGQTLGLKLTSKKVQIIGGRDVEAQAEVEIAGRKDTLSYKAELMPLSAARMSEEVISFKLPDPIGNQDLPTELRRSILVTYLDEEIMVVRDESGVPEVLVRETAPAQPKMEADSIQTADSATTAAAVTAEPVDDEDRALMDAAESEAS